MYVNIVDELGWQYGVTYAKRAKGLIKNGRARYVDENTICLINNDNTSGAFMRPEGRSAPNDPTILCKPESERRSIRCNHLTNDSACPPNIDNSEDNTMSEYINVYRDNDGKIVDVTEAAFEDNCDDDDTAAAGGSYARGGASAIWKIKGNNISPADILLRLDYIISESEFINKAIDNIMNSSSTEIPSTTNEKIRGIKAAVEAREQTNQKIINLLHEMYEETCKDRAAQSNGSTSRNDVIELLKTALKNPGLGDDAQKMIFEKLINIIN